MRSNAPAYQAPFPRIRQLVFRDSGPTNLLAVRLFCPRKLSYWSVLNLPVTFPGGAQLLARWLPILRYPTRRAIC
jgi:hypothetical protein